MEKTRVTIPQTVPLILFGVHAQVPFIYIYMYLLVRKV